MDKKPRRAHTSLAKYSGLYFVSRFSFPYSQALQSFSPHANIYRPPAKSFSRPYLPPPSNKNSRSNNREPIVIIKFLERRIYPLTYIHSKTPDIFQYCKNILNFFILDLRTVFWVPLRYLRSRRKHTHYLPVKNRPSAFWVVVRP